MVLFALTVQELIGRAKSSSVLRSRLAMTARLKPRARRARRRDVARLRWSVGSEKVAPMGPSAAAAAPNMSSEATEPAAEIPAAASVLAAAKATKAGGATDKTIILNLRESRYDKPCSQRWAPIVVDGISKSAGLGAESMAAG
jgi:hypothetical protein